MVIISRLKRYLRPVTTSLLLRVILVILAVMTLMLIIFTASPVNLTENMIYSYKHTLLLNKAETIASSLNTDPVLTPESVEEVMAVLGYSDVGQVVITDGDGMVLYSSDTAATPVGACAIYPEIVSALRGNDSFRSRFTGEAFESRGAIPVMVGKSITGCVYVVEIDREQAALLNGIQSNAAQMALITVCICIVLFLIFSVVVIKKNQRMLASLRQVREGDYGHRMEIHGHDEYAVMATEFNALTDRLQQTEESRRQFVSDASHELKTPLTVIMSNAELLQNPDCEEESRGQFAGNILSMSYRMRSLVEGLLELARADNGQIKKNFAAVDYSKLVSDSLLPFEPVMYERGLILESKIEPGITMTGSEQYLRQLGDILLDNAAKYSAPGIVAVELRRGAKGQCLLTVSNPGEPIPREDLKRIFQRFYRSDKARTGTGSFGLGLSIAESIVTEHKGRIWAESNSTGNRFCVQLPCK